MPALHVAATPCTVAAPYTIQLNITSSASTLAALQFVVRSDTEDRGPLATLQVADDGITFVEEGLSW